MRPVTLFTGQWADLPFEEICRKAESWGYDGLEIACWGDHMDVRRAAADPALRRRPARDSPEAPPGLLGARRPPRRAVRGRPVRRPPDGVRTGGRHAGKPEALRQWAVDEMKATARAAQGHGLRRRDRLHGLADLARVVLVPADHRGDGRGRVRRDPPPLDADLRRVRRAAACASAWRCTRPRSPSTCTRRSGCWRTFAHRPTLGFNFDPSHLVWQGLEPQLFIREFAREGLPCAHEGREREPRREGGHPGFAPAVRRSRAAAGTSGRSATATSTSRRSSGS